MKEHLPAAVNDIAHRTPAITRLRRYHRGEHAYPFATPKFLLRYRWLIAQSRENLMPAVVSAFTDLLQIEGWTNELDADIAARMDRLASFVHREAFLTGDAFTLTWTNPAGEIKPIFKRADQVFPHVSDMDPDQLDYAVLPWVNDAGYARADIYYPTHCERWISRQPIRTDEQHLGNIPTDMINWTEYTDEQAGPVIGHQFGCVPVVWWKRQPDDPWSHGRSVLTDVIPAQDELNFAKSVTNAAIERIANPIRYALADLPPEGSVEFDPTREDILGLVAKSAGEFPGPDGNALVMLQDKAERTIANIAGIPPYVFSQASGDVPSGEALRVLNSRRTAIVSAFASDASPTWRGQMQLLGYDTEPMFADPMPVAQAEAVAIAAEQKALGLPAEEWLPTAGFDPDSTDDTGVRLRDRVNTAASTTVASVGSMLRQGQIANGGYDVNPAP